MIKWQENNNCTNATNNQIADQNLYVCLSPFCFQPFNRIFYIDMKNQDNNYYLHDKPQCENWTLSLHQLRQHIIPYKKSQLQNIEMNFQAQPLQALKKIRRLQLSDWKKKLKDEINHVRKQVNKSFNELQQSITVKLENVLQKGEFYKDLVEIVSKSIDLKPSKSSQNAVFVDLSRQISQYLHKSHQIISQLKTVTFLSKVQLKGQLENIKNGIDTLQNKLIVSKLGKKQRNEQKKQFYQWIFAKEDNMFSRLQLIAGLFSKSPKTYHIQEEHISLNCFLCDKYVHQKIRPTHMKDLKKAMSLQIVIHIYNEHYDQVFFNFLKKIVKSNVKEIKVNQLFQSIRKYNEIHVIDRQTGAKYIQNFVSNQIFAIQLLTTKNVQLAQGRYVTLDTREGLNSLVAIIIRQCSKNGKRIMVISKRVQQVNQLYKMLQVNKEEGKCKIQFDGMQQHLQSNISSPSFAKIQITPKIQVTSKVQVTPKIQPTTSIVKHQQH